MLSYINTESLHIFSSWSMLVVMVLKLGKLTAFHALQVTEHFMLRLRKCIKLEYSVCANEVQIYLIHLIILSAAQLTAQFMIWVSIFWSELRMVAIFRWHVYVHGCSLLGILFSDKWWLLTNVISDAGYSSQRHVMWVAVAVTNVCWSLCLAS